MAQHQLGACRGQVRSLCCPNCAPNTKSHLSTLGCSCQVSVVVNNSDGRHLFDYLFYRFDKEYLLVSRNSVLFLFKIASLLYYIGIGAYSFSRQLYNPGDYCIYPEVEASACGVGVLCCRRLHSAATIRHRNPRRHTLPALISTTM